MSMSRYMHPRNIYKTRPDFKKLAIEYPEFRQHAKQLVNGKVILDFKDAESLRCLTRTLLLHDFKLDVEIPPGKLVPTLPLRLNYVLWIEDLLSIVSECEQRKGIDIGTGASCIYPLLLSTRNYYRMLATEIDSDSVNCAIGNVERNKLTELISVVKVNSSTLLKDAISDGGDDFDFCMCNPPFFASQQETIFEMKSRKLDRPRPKNAFVASHSEIIAKGGEVEFIERLIDESKVLGQRVKIYTTMIGHKTSLPQLKKRLRKIDVVSFKQTYFCQGNTTRWGLAWTFCDYDLRKVPEATLAAARKEKRKAVGYLAIAGETDTCVDEIGTKLIEIFDKLQILHLKLKHTKNVIAFNVTAHSNTWSHQRRKRRREEINLSIDETADLIQEMQVRSSLKRELDDEGYYRCKRIKVDNVVEAPLLEASALIRKDQQGIHVELIPENQESDKDVLHQVLQYVKNNLIF